MAITQQAQVVISPGNAEMRERSRSFKIGSRTETLEDTKILYRKGLHEERKPF